MVRSRRRVLRRPVPPQDPVDLTPRGRVVVGRRRMLGLLATGWVWLLLRLAQPGRRHESGLRSDQDSALLALFSRPDAAVALGRRYLALHPERGDRDRLRTELFPSSSVHGHSGSRALRRWIAARRQDDFLHSRVAQVDGWVLARSELVLCALVALASEASA